MASTVTESSTGKNSQEKSTTMDKAWSFIKDNLDVDDAAVAAVNMNAMRRQIDFRIVPLMFLCYTMQFLDKVILNYAAVMGLTKDLALKGNEFSNVATFLFVGLICFEVPNAFFLQYFPAAKWLGFNVICWGIATACVASATNYTTLLVARIFLGIFEATIAPSLALISSQWYTKSEQAPRFSFWYLGLGIGQIVGGAISYGFQHVHRSNYLSGWRAMFITLGVFTVAVGACVVLFLPDTPMQARWLSRVQKVALLKHVSVNQTGIQNRKFRFKEIIEALLDPQVYLLFVSNILLSVPSGVVTTYSATLIRNLHYSPKQAALMNMPSGAVSIFFTLLVGYGIQQKSYRFMWISFCIIPGIIGGALMSFMPITNRAGILAGIYLVNAIVAPMPVYFGWTVANVAGSTKRAFACAAMSAAFSLGNIIGPQTFQSKDAPQYRPAKITVLASCSAGLLTTFCLFMYYVWQNHRRGVDKVQQEEEYKKAEVWEALTDKENADFRYTY